MNLHKLAQQVCDARAQFKAANTIDANALLMQDDTWDELSRKAAEQLTAKNSSGRAWFVGLPIIVADIEEPFRVAYVL